jgi:hypothetical protein
MCSSIGRKFIPLSPGCREKEKEKKKCGGFAEFKVTVQ